MVHISELTPVNQKAVTESARSLLSGLIDYAGLFPPASLSMAEAVANYDEYLRGPYGWMLGRFIIPAKRLEEFEKALLQLPRPLDGQEKHWSLSALVEDIETEVRRILEFNYRFERGNQPRRLEVKSVELKSAGMRPAGFLQHLLGNIPIDLETYVEVPLNEAMPWLIEALGRCGRRAKIRMGGEMPNMFPRSSEVREFMNWCDQLKVPFKATAGLHHAIAGYYRLTQNPDSLLAEMHGFLNVFLAAAFARGVPAAFLHPRFKDGPIEEKTASAFRFESSKIHWRDLIIVSEEISQVRREFAVSFGSCSFMEPVEELRALHLI